MKTLLSIVFCLVCIALPAADEPENVQFGKPEPFQLQSSAFEQGGRIPQLYTRHGRDISPPLQWSGTPLRTVSLVLICDDPDAPKGAWVHWIVYNLDPELGQLKAGASGRRDRTFREGVNSWKNRRYNGPSPPRGESHRYFFKLYALDTVLNLNGPVGKRQLLSAMRGHVLARTALVGTYQREE